MSSSSFAPVFTLSVIALVSVESFAQAPPSAKTAHKRVLAYTVSAGYEHEVVHRDAPEKLSLVERALVELGHKSERFDVVPTRDARDFSAANLAGFDLVFFYTTGELPLSDEGKAALLEFVRQGNGFAGAHCATDTFYAWPAYGEMIGAYFDGHPWHELVHVQVEDREHPSTRALGAGFDITDEIYQFKAPYDRSKLHVLLSLDPTKLDLARADVHRTDRDFAVAWTHDFGRGRVFYTSLGHRPEVWADERYLKHLEGGFRWAMRDEESVAPKPAVPVVPRDFAVDLVAQAPEVRWPSAVLCTSDGSLLVGEDRMDMPGPTDKPVDRILRLRFGANGSHTTNVFAEGLNAVFGLEEVDGAVYVMNMPHLTVLRDRDGDGVADERRELITDLGPPAPGIEGGFNDHIVSGIRLGIDGFLYIAVGDKGIPGATGTDGRKLQMRGGGVVRVRPDGTELEVVARGLRNVLDVAIDERGEMFTYDNTDDGLGWWTRLTHVIDGGEYGYPWDYTQHPERTLPCMAEYGGGSPCGGLVYREAAWPKPYAGSLFFCEWGKGALRRFELEPDGATFRVRTAEDFMTAGDVADFRPLDVCESPDGRFLYVSDWAFSGWRDPKEAGRLWRVRRADDDARVPSVARPLPSDVQGLVAALDDQSFKYRLRAQRELARATGGARDALLDRVRSTEPGPGARHAASALSERHEFDPPKATAIDGDERMLAERLAKDPDRFVRFAARAALRSMQRVPPILSLEPSLRVPLVAALYECPWPGAVSALRTVIESDADDSLRANALSTLATSLRLPEPWDGKWWNIQPAKTPRPRNTVDWSETATILGVIRAALDDRSVIVRRTALDVVRDGEIRECLPEVCARWSREMDVDARARILDVLAALHDPRAGELVKRVLEDRSTDPVLRAHAVDAACALRTPELVGVLRAIAADTGAPLAQALSAIDALARLRDLPAVALLHARIADPSDDVRAAIPGALVRIDEDQAARAIEELLRDPSTAVRRSALRACGRLARRDLVPAILGLVPDPLLRDDALLALTETPDVRALQAYLLGLESSDAVVAQACQTAILFIRDVARGEIDAACGRGRLSDAQIALLQPVYAELQPLFRWRILGPLAIGETDPDFTGAAIDFKKRHADATGAEIDWIDYTTRRKDGFVDLERALRPAADVAAWAVSEFDSARQRTARMTIGSDDACRVWVNGKLVHDFAGERAWKADEDAFEAPLIAGTNTIFVRIGQGQGQWSFDVRIAGESAGPLFARAVRTTSLGELRERVREHAGDPARGYALFRSPSGPMCIRCHMVNGVGAAVGPDLSDIASKYDKEEILTSVLEPSRRIAEGYRSAFFELDDGRTVFGQVRSETADEVMLFDTRGEVVTLDVHAIAQRGTSDTSVMPDGLVATLSPSEVADLVAYLATLRGSPGQHR